MESKSMQDLAYDLVVKKKKPVQFEKLWTEVKAILGFSEEEAARRISSFYTRLTLDGRFVNLGDNIWDLRSRQTFDKVHIDMNDAYSDEEESEPEEVDAETPEEDLSSDDEEAEDEDEDYGDGD